MARWRPRRGAGPSAAWGYLAEILNISVEEARELLVNYKP